MSRVNFRKSFQTFALIVGVSVCHFVAFATVQKARGLQTEKPVFTKCWDYPSTPDLSVIPAADDTRVYFLNAGGKLEAADLASPTRAWSSELGGAVISNLLVTDSMLFVASSANQNEGRAVLRSLSKHTGITNWSVSISNAPRVTIGLVNGTLVAIESRGMVTAFRQADGVTLWTRQLDAKISSEPQFGSNEIVLTTERKEVVLIAVNDGKASVVAKTQSFPTAVMPLSDKKLLVGDERGNVTFYSNGGERSWKFRNGARISFLMPYDSEFLAVSSDNFIYKLSRSGNVEWKRRLSGRVTIRPVIIGDTAVVSAIGDSSVYFVDLRNGKISNRVESGDDGFAGIAAVLGRSAVILSVSRGLFLYSREQCRAKEKDGTDIGTVLKKS